MNSGRGWEFAPSAKLSYDLFKLASPGVEYYSTLGTVTRFESWEHQQHTVMPVIDFNLSEDWELNLGLGFGLTKSTDKLLLKLIVGYRF